MKIGILKEKEPEKRVAMLPDGVAVLVQLKASVLVESGAGSGSFAGDSEYRDAGAEVTGRDTVLKEANLLLMINAPGEKEIRSMKAGQIVVAAVNPLTNHAMVRSFADAGVTLFSLDVLPRISRAQAMDILSSQATVSGYKAVLDAASRLNGFLPMFMSAAGTIKPSKILVLGAGVAGLQAIATARKLGAVVEAFDVRSAVKEEVQSLGAKFVEVEGAIDDASAGGYAVEQSEEFKQRQQKLIQEHCMKADIVICTAQIPGRKAPLLVMKETVEAMKPGSVIIDLAASSGGNCALTKDGEVLVVNGVTVVGESNYPSSMPTDASRMFGRNLFNFISLLIDESGNINLNFEDELVKGTCVTHEKAIIHERVKEFMNS
ncbi:MAG TPA: Re/Si-specific NAD(P)(+) transhydrogenase subunit alpha [Bacteroidaceae bacterium]|nr:Re/Si-specific NAD(P)(+) transhydrogenase subunit alpha [Bacteroidaceae bacterium]